MSRADRKRFLTPFFVVVGAALLRVAASRGDFWLDEIWSWTFARQAASALDIFTRFPHDNNHILNTLFLYFLGDQRHWIVYRIPSVLAGVGTVILAGLIGRQTSRLAALTAMLLTGGSFLLVLYDSEARGYGLVIFFALLSLYVVDQYTRRSSWALAVTFALAAVLGLLSHLTYVHGYVGILVWSVYRFATPWRGWRGFLVDLARCHALPLAALLALYFGYVRRMNVGGGPPYSLVDVLVSTLSLTVGGPETGRAAVVVGLLAGLVVLVSLVALVRGQRDQLLLFGTAILLSPTLLLLADRPPALFPRYFLVPIALFLLLLSRFLGGIYRRGLAGKLGYFVLLLAFLCANGVHIAGLLQRGRGHYLDALRYMGGHTSSPVVSIGSDHDFRNSMVVNFYTRYLPAHKHAVYYDRASWPAGGSEWFLIHSQSPGHVPPVAIVAHGARYRLVKDYPFAGLSGWHWYVYHNTDYPLQE